MKKKATVAILLLAYAAFWLALIHESGKNHGPAGKCIGLTPAVDETRTRFMRDAVRNLVYENTSSDPLFYTRIVQKIEDCEWMKSNSFTRRTENHDGDLFSLEGGRFRVDALHEKTAFVSTDGLSSCIVYNGDGFVVVVLTDVWF